MGPGGGDSGGLKTFVREKLFLSQSPQGPQRKKNTGARLLTPVFCSVFPANPAESSKAGERIVFIIGH